MASLKVWHFFPNPLDLSDSWVSVIYTGAADGRGEIPFTGWGLPDASIMEHAPTEYIISVNVGYRENNTAGWRRFQKNIRYNSEMYESQNVLIFMSSLTDNNTYATAQMVGNLSVNPDFVNNSWIIYMKNVMAYLPNGTHQYPRNSNVFDANAVAMQGINIYY